MCGLVGKVSFSGVDTDLIRGMMASIAHRGPDDHGLWTDGVCVLGHQRLSIIDLTAAGRQPMVDEEDKLQIVFNGEIYNYRELRTELISKGHAFYTQTDTEVLLRAYKEWGVDSLDKLRGMYAYGIWNSRQRTLFLARDRIGKKPLFYALNGDRFYFASEIQGLLACDEISRELNSKAIDHYLSYGYIPAPLTAFLGIYKLPPAHYLQLNNAGIKLTRYWSLEYHPKSSISDDEACEELRHRLNEAVRRRQISDVPLGAFLSGGIDSSIIVGLMASQSSQPVRTFSIGFRESAFNELEHARRVARKWQTEHHEYYVEPDAVSILPTLVRHFGEPYADASAIPTYYVSRITRKQVTVALNGDGGDESFAGYERYLAHRLADQLLQYAGAAELLKLMSRMIPDNGRSGQLLRRLKKLMNTAALPRSERYQRWVTYLTTEQKRQLIVSGLFEEHSPGWIASLLESMRDLDSTDIGMATDVESYLPYDLLVKVDITSMANGLEARSPFLDQDVMEFAAKLPSTMKLRHGQSKYLLKKAFKDLLPPENIKRRKMGFGLPVGNWFRGPLREMLRDTLLSAKSGFYQPSSIEQVIGDHLAGRSNHTFVLWNLLMLELWYQQIYCGVISANHKNN